MRADRAIHYSAFGCMFFLVVGPVLLNQYALNLSSPRQDQVVTSPLSDMAEKSGIAITAAGGSSAPAKSDAELSATVTADGSPAASATTDAELSASVTASVEPGAVITSTAEPTPAPPGSPDQRQDDVGICRRPGGQAELAALAPINPGSTEALSFDITSDDSADDCSAIEPCLEQYLWLLYERTPKIDAVKVIEKHKMTVKRKGKTRTVVKTVVRYEDENFEWKDPAAADKAGLPLKDYVIGGMDPSFRQTVYRALRAMDAAGLMPGITSAFRDDYRQAIASGKKAAIDRSFHGGSSRGGYGHGLAVDLVSVKGATRGERYRSSEELWSWVDQRGKEFGIGRPYLDRDAPHVGPIDGREYAMKRGGDKPGLAAKATPKRLARLEPRRRAVAAAKPAKTAASKPAKTAAAKPTKAAAAKPAKAAASKRDKAPVKTYSVASAATPSRQAHRAPVATQPQKRSRKLSATRTIRGTL